MILGGLRLQSDSLFQGSERHYALSLGGQLAIERLESCLLTGGLYGRIGIDWAFPIHILNAKCPSTEVTSKTGRTSQGRSFKKLLMLLKKSWFRKLQRTQLAHYLGNGASFLKG